MCLRQAFPLSARARTAHLSVAGSTAQAATNAAQCEELTAILGRNGQDQARVFGGDVNRQDSCAPAGFWTLTDEDAAQAPGTQRSYGPRGWLLAPQTQLVSMTYTNHDVLLVETRLRQAGTGHGAERTEASIRWDGDAMMASLVP